jgi:hypothetical protein
MKRREFLAVSLIMPISAAVFTATGWLMGTKVLTMPPPEAPTPPPGEGVGQTYINCADCDTSEQAYCLIHWQCRNGNGWWDEWYGCRSQGCAAGWCAWRAQSTGPC